MGVLIGITAASHVEERKAPLFHGARESYIQAIIAAGGLPVVIPLSDDERYLRGIFEEVNGILIPGGEDVSPELYGEPPHFKLKKVNNLRDKVEAQLARWCVAEDKPLLGICRGIQIINVALGGSLYQDIEAQTGSTQHHEPSRGDPWRTLAHEVKLVPQGLIYSLFLSNAIQVNSLHHQGVKELAAGLIALGHAPDGLVEVAEYPERRFNLAVQCHPEVLWQDVEPRWKGLFRAFVAAAAEGINP